MIDKPEPRRGGCGVCAREGDLLTIDESSMSPEVGAVSLDDDNKLIQANSCLNFRLWYIESVYLWVFAVLPYVPGCACFTGGSRSPNEVFSQATIHESPLL